MVEPGIACHVSEDVIFRFPNWENFDSPGSSDCAKGNNNQNKKTPGWVDCGRQYEGQQLGESKLIPGRQDEPRPCRLGQVGSQPGDWWLSRRNWKSMLSPWPGARIHLCGRPQVGLKIIQVEIHICLQRQMQWLDPPTPSPAKAVLHKLSELVVVSTQENLISVPQIEYGGRRAPFQLDIINSNLTNLTPGRTLEVALLPQAAPWRWRGSAPPGKPSPCPSARWSGPTPARASPPSPRGGTACLTKRDPSYCLTSKFWISFWNMKTFLQIQSW